VTVAAVADALAARYPPQWADPDDSVGLMCGEPDAPVHRVLFTVDTVAETVGEAVAVGASLLVTHHPPPVDVSHQAAAAGLALYVAHTNAAVARPGVSDALAELLGLGAVRPLVPVMEKQDIVVTFVPLGEVDRVIDALAATGAGAIGDYRRCAWMSVGTGTFLPGTGAQPAAGSVGRVTTVPEVRVEMVALRSRRAAVIAALRAVHPYEEPAFYLLELADMAADRGYGRIGELAQPATLAELVARLPAAGAPVRVAGDPHRPVRSVAVCGGAGGRFLDEAVRAGVDAYLTGDLDHHAVAQCLQSGGPALVDAGHWVTERPWLDVGAHMLARDLDHRVAVAVSKVVTDPWQWDCGLDNF
jgi:dinuclear metal center YbgI/SA1388 family protein